MSKHTTSARQVNLGVENFAPIKAIVASIVPSDSRSTTHRSHTQGMAMSASK
ncbi:MAG: hypothetical protein NDJ18_01955 [candidate division Zixibacteria bacterium]|nr:hypothetical protein [candidate division Zixibacteria bacterium]